MIPIGIILGYLREQKGEIYTRNDNDGKLAECPINPYRCLWVTALNVEASEN